MVETPWTNVDNAAAGNRWVELSTYFPQDESEL